MPGRSAARGAQSHARLVSRRKPAAQMAEAHAAAHIHASGQVHSQGSSHAHPQSGATADSLAQPKGAAALSQALRAQGLRPTRARLDVYRLLVESGAPLSHTDVTSRLKHSRDRVTLYRALDSLVEHGLAHTVSFPDRKRRFAACVEHPPHAGAHSDDHAHFICSNCAATLCVGTKQMVLGAVKRWLPKSYRLTGLDVLLYGLCPACQRAS